MPSRVALKYIGAGIMGAAAVAVVALGLFWAQDASAQGNQEEPTLPAIWVEVGNPAAGQPKSPYIKGKEGNRVLVPAGHGVTGEHFQRWRACPITGFTGVTTSGHIKVTGGGIDGSTDGVDVLLNRYVTNADRNVGEDQYQLRKKATNGGPFTLANANLGLIIDALDFKEPVRDTYPHICPECWNRALAMSRIHDSGARTYSYTSGALGATVHNGVAKFTIRLAKPSTHTVTIAYTTGSGTLDDPASAATGVASMNEYKMDGSHDYLPTSGSAVFQPGETQKSFNVPIINDCVNDPGEKVGFWLSSVAGDTALSSWFENKVVGNHYVIQNHDTVVLPENFQPAVVSAISDATIVNESGTRQVSLSGVFSDADSNTLTITARSSDTAIATAAVATDQSSLTVTAKKRGAATITVTASDGNGGSVDDTFTVKVKTAPVVASAIADVSGLVIGGTHKVSVSGVFSDADSDALTITATSSSDAIATAAVAADGSSVNLAAKSRGTATITVTAQDSDGNQVSDAFDVTVVQVNNPPTVSSSINDATIVNESRTHQVSLSGVFSDADQDSLTITASSSEEKITTVSVSADYATLTLSAQARGSATITVTANDGNGGSVVDAFTVTVKAAPVVANAIADVSELAVDATHEISLSGLFADADGDALTVSATTSDSAVVHVSNTIDPSTGSATAITVTGVDFGTATITVTARDSDGNSVSDEFDVTVPAAQEQQAAELPGPVVGLELTASAENSVIVRWSAPETGGAPKGYIVHLKPENGKKGSGKIKRPKAKKTQVKFNNLQSGQTYEVWVRAQNEAGKGERIHATITLPE